MMSSEPDEFDEYNLSDFTEDDFLAIEAHISQSLSPPDPTDNAVADPRVDIQYESSQQEVASTSRTTPLIVVGTNEEDGKNADDPSPFERFRRGGILSVTDLVAPAWCELQFDYGLRQKRSRKLQNRPSSFVSRQGKEISVQQEVAVRNDAVTKNGKAVHKKLEQEIPTEQVKIDITTKEDAWGLRLLNIIWSLDCLSSLGFTREMSVFGLIHDHVVTGIIDEVNRTPITENAKPRRTKSPPPSQQRITSFVQTTSPRKVSASADAGPSGKPRQCLLSIIDAKSRRSNTLPSHENTTSSRLQLMLYHRLLSNLISQSSPFPFSSFWDKLDLDPTKPFSSNFLDQLQVLREDYASIMCLNDLSAAWSESVTDLNTAGVNPKLKLVYRMQTNDSRKRKTRIARSDTILDLTVEQDTPEIVRALRGGSENALDADMAAAITASLAGDVKEAVTDDPELAWAIQQSLLEAAGINKTTPDQTGESQDTPPPPPQVPIEEEDAVDSKIIGTTEFQINDVFLDDYLTNVLQYWHGEREAVGVDIHNAGRCFTCEYRDGCEWREKKAREAEVRARARRLDLTTTASKT